MNITLDRLRYFVEVATHQHVGLAARNLAVSPSVISSAIRVLEEELGKELFTREGKRLRLNGEGSRLRDLGLRLLEDAAGLYTQLATTGQELRGHYRVGASPALAGQYLMKPWLATLKDERHLTVEFICQDTGALIANVLSGHLDMAIVYSPLDHQGLREKVLKRGQFQLAVRKNHPLLRKRGTQLVAGLNGLPMIAFKATVGPNLSHWPVFNRHGIKPVQRFTYDNDQLAVELLVKSDGWALLPDNVLEEHPGKIQPLSLPGWVAPMRISLVSSRQRPRSAVLERFEEWFGGEREAKDVGGNKKYTQARH